MSNDPASPINAIGFRKTRIAPTPSGFLHLGNVFSFALTALLAERHSARILLRIDDLDQQRVRPEYVQDIFDTLHFLELPWHEGPRNAAAFASEYSQLHRLPLYHEALTQLKDGGHLFACACSRTDILRQNTGGIYNGTCISKPLNLDTPEVSWRLRTPAAAPLSFNSPAGKVSASLPEEQRWFAVRRKDGYPAYQLASVIDDVSFGVDLIVRGLDLYPSTLAQLYLADCLGLQDFKHNVFYHHRLLSLPDGSKLSKSAGATSIRYLRLEGKTPSAIYTLIGNQLGIGGTLNHWRDLEPLLQGNNIL